MKPPATRPAVPLPFQMQNPENNELSTRNSLLVVSLMKSKGFSNHELKINRETKSWNNNPILKHERDQQIEISRL
jgi:hypothetical protein